MLLQRLPFNCLCDLELRFSMTHPEGELRFALRIGYLGDLATLATSSTTSCDVVRETSLSATASL